MATRLELQAKLETLATNVYHQPPSGHKMDYPCIVYSRDDILVNHANNKRYKYKNRYQVTVIDADPDSVIPDMVAELPLCSFDRAFKSDNLNHNVFNLYF